MPLYSQASVLALRITKREIALALRIAKVKRALAVILLFHGFNIVKLGNYFSTLYSNMLHKFSLFLIILRVPMFFYLLPLLALSGFWIIPKSNISDTSDVVLTIDGNTYPESLPLSTNKIREHSEFSISFNINVRDNDSLVYSFYPDDCILGIRVNGKAFPQEMVKEPCAYGNGTIIDLSEYTQKGLNKIELQMKNNGGPGGLVIKDLKPLQQFGFKHILFVLLLVASSLLLILKLNIISVLEFPYRAEIKKISKFTLLSIRRLSPFLILALFISIILEITLFNYTHYGTLFTSKRFSIAYNNQKSHFEGDVNYSLNGISENDSLLKPEPQGQLNFANLNTEIASIYIDPIFIQGDKQRVTIIWTDEESLRSINASIIKDLDFSNYITITPRGKVSDLKIKFLENNIGIKQVELNKEIPMAIMPIRLVIVFAISLLLLCLKNAETRKKISYFCFDYLYDKTSFRQHVGFAMLVCFMLVFNFLLCYFLNGFRDDNRWYQLYSYAMTDTFLKKQLHLDLEVSQALLQAERPYDPHYRSQHGIPINWDYSYYEGKYYSYFGMVPVIILFAPYKLLTGDHLQTSMGNFLFASMATVLLLLLWKQIAQDYLKKLPYFFFLIVAMALYACSRIPIHMFEAGGFYIVPTYSGLAFVFLGLIMLLRARENLSIKCLIISSFSFALAVGCRPTSLFMSILVPVMLWDKRKELNVSKILAIIIPFVIIGSILAWYNYARFDSPFKFGDTYQLGGITTSMINQVGIIGKIHFSIKTVLFLLFNPPNLDLTFPFVSAKMSNIHLAITNAFPIYGPTVGIFSFPVMWFLLCVRKVTILRNFIFAGIFISSLNITLLAFGYGIVWKYSMDFSWIMAICASICAFQLQEKEIAMRKVILKAFYSCCVITLLLAFFLTISYCGERWSYDKLPYLARTFGVICNVP